MTIDRETGENIARLMANLRPEWDYPGCVAAVKAVARKHPADVALAAVRIAMTPEARTPMALTAPDGPHWHEKLAPPAVRHPPRHGQDCPNHPGEWPDACRGCASDRLAGTETKPNPRRTPANPDALKTARAALTRAKHQHHREKENAK